MLTLMVKTVEQTFAVCSVLMRSAPGFTSPRSNDWDRVSESVHKSHSAGTLRTVECLYLSAVFAQIAGQEVREWSGGWAGGIIKSRAHDEANSLLIHTFCHIMRMRLAKQGNSFGGLRG